MPERQNPLQQVQRLCLGRLPFCLGHPLEEDQTVLPLAAKKDQSLRRLDQLRWAYCLQKKKKKKKKKKKQQPSS